MYQFIKISNIKGAIHTQKNDFLSVTNICDTDNRAWFLYNRICRNNNYFLSLLLFSCHHYSFLKELSPNKNCRLKIVILTKYFFAC